MTEQPGIGAEHPLLETLKDKTMEEIQATISELNKKLSSQKGIKVEFETITGANHFFTKSEQLLVKTLSKYIKKETTLF